MPAVVTRCCAAGLPPPLELRQRWSGGMSAERDTTRHFTKASHATGHGHGQNRLCAVRARGVRALTRSLTAPWNHPSPAHKTPAEACRVHDTSPGESPLTGQTGAAELCWCRCTCRRALHPRGVSQPRAGPATGATSNPVSRCPCIDTPRPAGGPCKCTRRPPWHGRVWARVLGPGRRRAGRGACPKLAPIPHTVPPRARRIRIDSIPPRDWVSAIAGGPALQPCGLPRVFFQTLTEAPFSRPHGRGRGA